MRVTFLGTAAVTPGGGHDTACLLIDRRVLVDTGWNAAINMRRFGFDPLDVDTLIFTHLHHDHYLGLPHLLFYIAMRRGDRPNRQPLRILGPSGDTEEVVRLSLAFLQAQRYPEVAHLAPEVVPLRPGESYADGDLRISTCASLHPVMGICYRFEDETSRAAFTYTGDTAPNRAAVELAAGCDLLVHEASYGADPAPAHNPWGHCGAPDAARAALGAGVRRLALVHCPEDKQQAAVAAAQAVFAQTFWPGDGETLEIVRGGMP